MGKIGTIFFTGIAIAMVGTALFSPGKQTVAGIQAGGVAASRLAGTAEGLNTGV
jgi:hypothetical protein